MKEIDAAGFDERVAKCSLPTRELITFLKTVAENSGLSVAAPTFEVRGIGITFWTNGRRFCRFDPKHQADHVWALIPNSDRHALHECGSVSDREDGPWVTIKTMPGAVRLVRHILNAYDAAQTTV
jgi:hypothetical protein